MAPRQKPVKRERIDILLVQRGMVPSRERGRALLMAGKVVADGNRVDKPGQKIDVDAEIRIKGEDNPYVSRGGLKLAGALEHFGVDVTDKVALDVGASTGGFTDCLLQNGAVHVYGVDVGYGLIADKLRRDERVTLFERTNFRHFDKSLITEKIEVATVDVSFISLRLILPVLRDIVVGSAQLLVLVKPQFEVGKGEVGKGGIVRDRAKVDRVLQELETFAVDLGFVFKGVNESPITGAKGNREYFFYLTV
jgi:23S rRNA (cytidine1920-2'-O)/16S rRNA (cytidine1409-2'-O)-methyltransferase